MYYANFNLLVFISLSEIYGGAKKKSSTKASLQKSKRSARYDEEDNDYDDFDEDNDDYDDYDDDIPPRSKRGRSRASNSRRKSKSKGKSSYSLIPWAQSRPSTRDAKSKRKSTFSIRERLQQIAKTGQSAYKDIYRRAKVWSLPFEVEGI